MIGTIDRFEGDYAVVYVHDRRINIPRDLLPQDVQEGTCLKITIEMDHNQTKNRQQTIEGLLAKLKNKS